jgi:hypothetical protein
MNIELVETAVWVMKAYPVDAPIYPQTLSDDEWKRYEAAEIEWAKWQQRLNELSAERYPGNG